MILLERVFKKKLFSTAKFEEYFIELKCNKTIKNQTLLICFLASSCFDLQLLELKSKDDIQKPWHRQIDKSSFLDNYNSLFDFLKEFDTDELSLWSLRILYNDCLIDFSCVLNQPHKPFIRVYSDTSDDINTESLLFYLEKRANEYFEE